MTVVQIVENSPKEMRAADLGYGNYFLHDYTLYVCVNTHPEINAVELETGRLTVVLMDSLITPVFKVTISYQTSS